MDDKLLRLPDLAGLKDVTDDATMRPIGELSLASILAAPKTRNEPAEPPPPSPACPDCGGASWYKQALRAGHPDFGKLFACHCLLERQAERASSYAAERRQEILSRLASELGELAHCRFENFTLKRPYGACEGATAAEQARSLRHALTVSREYARLPRGWLYLFGPPGSGKSHLAAAVGHVLAEQGMDVYYRSAPDMLDALLSGYRAGDYDERLEALRVVTVLILDDLGTEADTEQARAKLFQIINSRAQYDRLTIITSNVPVKALHFRIASRIRGAANEVPVLASDYRALKVRR